VRIALFDQVVGPQSPAGSRDQRIIEELAGEHEFTIFSSALSLEGGNGARVVHVAVPPVRGPALLSFLAYFVGAGIAYARQRMRGRRFDLLHVTDCAFPVGDVFYAHFCHRVYLRDVWPRVRGAVSARTVHNWVNLRIRTAFEAALVRRAGAIVVPSEGLKREMSRAFPSTEQKITVIRNTVDVDRFSRPAGFDARPTREMMDTGDEHTAFVFVALGHFERKGLPLLLDALSSDQHDLAAARLWVVGGEPARVAEYRRRAEDLGVADQVSFAGKTEDVRRFLWSADAFVSPSRYEAFSLVLLEAAGAGLPLLVSRVSGSDELLVDGVNGIELELAADGVAAALARFLALDEGERSAMRRAASASVEPLRPERFDAAWRALYTSLDGRSAG
jgi:glycosyltransferase involved in cell wall biosynthesis